MLEGRDLPTCDLSKYLQQQLDETLATDTAARAAACGRDVSQVRSGSRDASPTLRQPMEVPLAAQAAAAGGDVSPVGIRMAWSLASPL